MPHVLDGNATIVGSEIRLYPAATHGEALAALDKGRRAHETALVMAHEILSLNPTEGKARDMREVAMRYLALVA